jgi:hypothetical protein
MRHTGYIRYHYTSTLYLPVTGVYPYALPQLSSASSVEVIKQKEVHCRGYSKYLTFGISNILRNDTSECRFVSSSNNSVFCVGYTIGNEKLIQTTYSIPSGLTAMHIPLKGTVTQQNVRIK